MCIAKYSLFRLKAPLAVRIGGRRDGQRDERASEKRLYGSLHASGAAAHEAAHEARRVRVLVVCHCVVARVEGHEAATVLRHIRPSGISFMRASSPLCLTNPSLSLLQFTVLNFTTPTVYEHSYSLLSPTKVQL